MAGSSSDAQLDHSTGNEISKDVVIYTLCVLFNLLSIVSVVLRFITRGYILNIFGADDITIIIAEVLSTGVTMTTFIRAAIGGLRTPTGVLALKQATVTSKGIFASFLLYYAAQTFIKISLLIQIKRVFTGEKTQRCCYIGLGLVAVMGVIQEITTAFSCSPLKMTLPPWRDNCIPFLTVNNANSAMNIITVFFILCIPIAPVLRLQIRTRYKISLLGVFCLGILACAISIVRLHEFHVTYHSSSPAWANIPTEYWSVIELNVGILCACLPTVRPLLKKVAPGIFGTLYPRTATPAQGVPSPNAQRVKWLGNRKSHSLEKGLYRHEQAEISSTTELQYGRSREEIPQVHLRIGSEEQLYLRFMAKHAIN